MKLWKYLKEKMQLYADRVAFANSNITYAQLLALEKEKSSFSKLRLCDGKAREEQALHIITCIAEGDVVVPISWEYGEWYCNQIKKLIEGSDEDVSDLAFLMFTSGTTGKPKGVMLTDENIITNLNYIQTYFDVKRFNRICIARPLVHISVVINDLLYALCNGLTIYFYEESFMPRRVISYFLKEQIDIFCATPTLYLALAKEDKERRLPIKVGVISGEVLTEEAGRLIADRFPNTLFYHVYGLTEHSPRVCALSPQDFKRKPNSVGKPIGDVKVKIRNGELLVNSPSVMKGYYKDKNKTKEKIGDGWLHTGDIVHIDEQGDYYIDGRKDGMLIRAGINIYPEEIERSVRKIQGIEDCLAYPIDTENGILIGLKYVGNIEVMALRKMLVKFLNPNTLPNKIENVEELPHTASGKRKRI